MNGWAQAGLILLGGVLSMLGGLSTQIYGAYRSKRDHDRARREAALDALASLSWMIDRMNPDFYILGEHSDVIDRFVENGVELAAASRELERLRVRFPAPLRVTLHDANQAAHKVSALTATWMGDRRDVAKVDPAKEAQHDAKTAIAKAIDEVRP